MSGRPATPQIVDLGPDAVSLAWLTQDFNCGSDFYVHQMNAPFEGYQVQYRQVGEIHWQLANVKPHLDSQFTVRNLKPFAEYEFRTVAKTACGFSQPSNPSIAVKLRGHFSHLSSDFRYDRGAAFAPGRPRVVESDGTKVVLCWEPPVAYEASSALVGYHVEYRVVGALDWITATNQLVKDTTCQVPSLRPGGLYEFRVFAKSLDGVSTPSPISAEFRVRAFQTVGYNGHAESISFDNFSCADAFTPQRPEIIEVTSHSVTLIWPKISCPGGNFLYPVTYIVEFREIGSHIWKRACSELPIVENYFTVNGLNPKAPYEFRVLVRRKDGSVGQPSDPSDMCQLPMISSDPFTSQNPQKPQTPEILHVSKDCVTICWKSPCSPTAIHGYQVEFRDLSTSRQKWLPVNPFLVQGNKMTIGDLQAEGEYEFRVAARNVAGFSMPSDPSAPVYVGPSRSTCDDCCDIQLTGQRSSHGFSLSVVRNALPLPTKSGESNSTIAYRDPTLAEVLEYFDCSNNVLRVNATGYLQHLTFNDDKIKSDLGGISRLLNLLCFEVPELQKNICGCLKNLSYGVDENKKAILNAGGVTILSSIFAKSNDDQILDEIVCVFSNLSSHEELKLPILQNVAELLIRRVIIPFSGFEATQQGLENHLRRRGTPSSSNLFRGATSVLRNVSSSGDLARKFLKEIERLVESLIKFVHVSCENGEFDTKSLENVICVLRNLSYRLQETQESCSKSSNGHSIFNMAHERSSVSPKLKSSDFSKSKINGPFVNGQSEKFPHALSFLWQTALIRDYLILLEQSSNPEILEASAGAIQNLAACHWQPSIEIRAVVRKEKGLPTLVKLLPLDNDKVVCAVATTLRNLSLDQRNMELIGKYAMDDLVKKLPHNSTQSISIVHEDTVAAILSVLYVTTSKSPEFSRCLLDRGGVQKLIELSNCGQYTSKIAKYACQILYCLWQHKELHELYRKAGFKESSFVRYAAKFSNYQQHRAETLTRLFSTQGVENHTGDSSLVRPDWNDFNGDFSSSGPGSINSACSTDKSGKKLKKPKNCEKSTVYAQIQKECNYASVNRLNKPVDGYALTTNFTEPDSWV